MLFPHTANTYPIQTYTCYTCLFATKLCNMNLSSDQRRTLCLLKQFSQIQWEKEFSNFPFLYFRTSSIEYFMVMLSLAPSSFGKLSFNLLYHSVTPALLDLNLCCSHLVLPVSSLKAPLTFILNIASCICNSACIQM